MAKAGGRVESGLRTGQHGAPQAGRRAARLTPLSQSSLSSWAAWSTAGQSNGRRIDTFQPIIPRRSLHTIWLVTITGSDLTLAPLYFVLCWTDLPGLDSCKSGRVTGDSQGAKRSTKALTASTPPKPSTPERGTMGYVRASTLFASEAAIAGNITVTCNYYFV